MAYYSISKNRKHIFIHFESAPDSSTVWRLKHSGWEWDHEGRRWCSKYSGFTEWYAQELSGTNKPAFIVSQGSYCGFWGDNLKWTLDPSGSLSISGTGDMPDFAYDQLTDLPWYRLRHKITSITVEDGITSIGKRVFYDLPNLRRVTLLDSVTSVEERAFSHCQKLSSIRLSDNLTKLGPHAFQDCTSLNEIHLPSSASNIGFECFKNWKTHQKIYKTTKDTTTGEYVELQFCSNQIASKSITEIFFEDFVVVTDNSHCANDNHVFEDIYATINILQRDGTLRTVTIPAGRCKTCNKYFIRTHQFDNLRNIGVILCRMIHETYVLKTKSGNFYDTLSPESWLKQYGYTTDIKHNLTDTQRRQILICLMESDINARQKIINHLSWLIQQHKCQVKMFPAVTKWTADRSFVESHIFHFLDMLKNTSMLSVDGDSITLNKEISHFPENKLLRACVNRSPNPIIEINKLDAKAMLEEVIRYV